MRGVLEAADDAASACLAEPSLSFVLCCSSAQDEPRGCWWQVLLSLGILQDCIEGDQTPLGWAAPRAAPCAAREGHKSPNSSLCAVPSPCQPLDQLGLRPRDLSLVISIMDQAQMQLI